MVRTTLRAARRTNAEGKPVELQLQLGAKSVGTVTLMGSPPRRLGFDALSGESIDGPEGGRALHLFLLRLHRGDLFGAADTWLSIACGIGLFTLCATGLWVYEDLLRRRFRRGLNGLFWR